MTNEPTKSDRHLATIIEEPQEMRPAHSSPFASALDQKRFKQQLDKRSDNRETLMSWIRDALKDGVDYGRIHVVKKENCSLGNRCTDPFHYSKPSLWKPGAEKIAGMLGLSVSFPTLPDIEAAFIAGRKIEQLVLRCVLTNDLGQIIGQGIGARSLAQDHGDLNKALKMAEKSAMIDAVLRAGGLSEIFTQDLDAENPEAIDPYTPGADPQHNPYERSESINLETHCTIGKAWKGKRWSEVDTGFLEFIIEKIDDKPELVARAQRELAERHDPEPDRADAAPPQTKGTPQLGGFARQLLAAKTIEEIDAAWAQMPPDYQRMLRKTYDAERMKLEGGAA
jgi:hypothetical protein